MIIELGITMLALAGFAQSIYVAIRPTVGDDSFYNKLEDYENEFASTKYSAHVELVLELLKSDKPLTCTSTNPGAHSTHFHYTFEDVGARINKLYTGISKRIQLALLDDWGNYVAVEITSEEGKALEQALESYQTREKSATDRKLTKLLAQRVLNPGEVHPVLGTPDVPSEYDALPDDNDQRGKLDIVPAGYLTFDESRQQIVQIGGGDSVQMSRVLETRYGLRGAPGVSGDSYLDNIKPRTQRVMM